MFVSHRDFGEASGTAGALSNLDWDSSRSISISTVYPCCASFLSRETALIDFPHSRQTCLIRGVISPQNGHILCDRTSWIRGLNLDSNFRRDSRAEASRRRREGRYCSINFTLPVLLIESISDKRNDDMARPAILCRIAHIATHSLVRLFSQPLPRVYPRCLRTEQFRPAIRSGCAHHDA
jgi:hypothetical protein